MVFFDRAGLHEVAEMNRVFMEEAKEAIMAEGVPVLRCKMRVIEVLRSNHADGHVEYEQVKLVAVSGNEGTENAEWSKYTPTAAFSIHISNPKAHGQLSSGHEFYVDFTPA